MEQPEGGGDEGVDGLEEPIGAPRKSPLVKIIAIVVAAAVAGAGVYVLVLANSPPTAAFTARSTDFRVVVDASNSTDPDRNIVNYSWSWDDGQTGFGIQAAHVYAAEQTYTINLTVRDARGASGQASEPVEIQVLPVAHFIARHEAMKVSFDASGSSHSLNRLITNYTWDLGGGTAAYGPKVTRTYSSPGRQVVTLTVTDELGRRATASRYVSPASVTVDIVADQFFEAGCPYRQYWSDRYQSYGDRILRNDVPCTDYYPWVLFSSAVNLQRINPSYVYALYRWDAKVRNHAGYTLLEPVILPTFNASVAPAPGSYIEFNLTFEYFDPRVVDELNDTGFRVNPKYSDGFGFVLRGNYTMDLTMSRRIFGVGDTATFSPTASPVSQWTNPDNGLTSDNRYTTTRVNGNTSVYRNNTVPQLPTSPILKVEVGLEGRTDGDDDVRLAFSTDGGANWENAGTVDLGATDVTTFFDVTSLRSWTPALLNNTNFRSRIEYVQVGGTSDLIYVDWVPVRVKSDVPFWWAAATNSADPSPRNPGPVETSFASWLENQGNGKYDVYNGFEWFYESDITWLNATVANDGTTRVQVLTDGWALDVMMARWWYWGKANYRDAVCVQGQTLTCAETLPYGAIQPAGWAPMETCWCEAGRFDGRIDTALDLDYVTIQGYSYEAWSNWGRDGVPRTADDQATWAFVPNHMDYVPRQGSGSPGAQGYPHSELRWYEGLTSFHATPGSYGYGQRLEFLVAPVRWRFNEGSTLTIVLPRMEVPWYDPYRSTWNPDTKIGDYVTFMSTMDLRLIRPTGNYYLWDARAKVLSFAGPHDWGVSSTELPLESWPWIEFKAETSG